MKRLFQVIREGDKKRKPVDEQFFDKKRAAKAFRDAKNAGADGVTFHVTLGPDHCRA